MYTGIYLANTHVCQRPINLGRWLSLWQRNYTVHRPLDVFIDQVCGNVTCGGKITAVVVHYLSRYYYPYRFLWHGSHNICFCIKTYAVVRWCDDGLLYHIMSITLDQIYIFARHFKDTLIWGLYTSLLEIELNWLSLHCSYLLSDKCYIKNSKNSTCFPLDDRRDVTLIVQYNILNHFIFYHHVVLAYCSVLSESRFITVSQW